MARQRGGAIAVAAGIFLSRISGLVRERAIAHYLGMSPAAGAFRAALRIPNLLQNLLGEGVLSASFIPVYAKLRAEGRDAEASQVARAVGTLLALVAATIAAIGVLAAEPIVDLLAPGFGGETRAMTVAMVRILFPGTALLVLSAWCLGVLNSHKRFFLPYVAPVLWNAAQIAAVIVAGRALAGNDDDIAVWLAWGVVIGSAAQLVVQVPSTLRLLRGGAPSVALTEGVKKTMRAFVPSLLGRGSAQLSGYIDQVLASYLGEAIVAGMANAQTLYMLPVSLFGMSISAAELPEMSAAKAHEEIHARLTPALRRVVFLVVPSAIAFATIGGSIIALLFETGRFGAHDTTIVWLILAGSAIGLSAGTQSRLLVGAHNALGDTTRPMYAALVRLVITAGAGYAFALPIRDALGYSATWGAFGLTASAGVAAWVEFLLVERWLSARIGKVKLPTKLGLGALGAAVIAGGLGYGTSVLAAHLALPRWLGALGAIGVYGVTYLGIMIAARVPEVSAITRRLRR